MGCRGPIFLKNECYEYSLCMSGVSVSTGGENNIDASKIKDNSCALSIFFNIATAIFDFFTFSPHSVIALPKIILISLLHFLYRFYRLAYGFFSVLLPM